MIRVYIAGKFNDSNVLAVARNCRTGHAMAVRLLRLGFAVFDPWLDLHWALIADLPIEIFKANSMAWLERSHAILMLPSSKRSHGATAEMERANELGIPIFWSVTDLVKWFSLKEGKHEEKPVDPVDEFDLDDTFGPSADAPTAKTDTSRLSKLANVCCGRGKRALAEDFDQSARRSARAEWDKRDR